VNYHKLLSLSRQLPTANIPNFPTDFCSKKLYLEFQISHSPLIGCIMPSPLPALF
jgi:hypothetical protein